MTSSPTDPQIKVTYLDHMGNDLTTVNAARVSFNKTSDWEKHAYEETEYGPAYSYTLSDKDAKLIEYLGRHGHDSPMNHNALSVHVKMPIFVARQLVKHEYLVLNEISRRYVDSKPEFYTPDAWRKRSEDKKQGSGEGTIDLSKLGVCGDEPIHESGWENSLQEYMEDALGETYNLYEALLAANVAPEQARMVLPLSTMTEWHWTGLLSAWAKMVNQRIAEDTQYETRLVAQQVDHIASHLWPHSWKALRSMSL